MKASLRLMTALALLSAGTMVAAQAPRHSVVIGCVQRNGNNFVLNDFRGGSFRLESLPKDFEFHVGHKVELTGSYGKAGTTETFKIDSVIYISTTCQ
jgi:hypothetical protein